MAQPQEGAPARPRTHRSRWRPGLGAHVRAARVGSPLAGRGCTGDKTLSAWPVREQRPTAVRTWEPGCAMRGATAALAPRAGFREVPCSRRPNRRTRRTGDSEAGVIGAGVQVRERGQHGDRRRHRAGEAVLAEGPARYRARRNARVARGGGTARRSGGAQVDQPGERRDARGDGPGERVREQGPARARADARAISAAAKASVRGAAGAE